MVRFLKARLLQLIGLYEDIINVYRQPQQILLFSSTHATCFGRTNHPQALNTRYLKLKIKCIKIIKIYGEVVM